MGSQPYNHHDPRMQPGPSQSSPYASHDGTGPYYSPPAYPYPAPMNRQPAGGGYMPPRAPNVLPGYRPKQRVSARIMTDTWVMGVVIGVVHICSKITGGTYVVEFESIDGTGRRERREFTDEELVPYAPGR